MTWKGWVEDIDKATIASGKEHKTNKNETTTKAKRQVKTTDSLMVTHAKGRKVDAVIAIGWMTIPMDASS